jgi:tRNA(Ile)-lysidine synthetase-like protein
MKILAVSGGIDSVVMLHQMKDEPDILVAHYDHGIRPNSAEDCAFVERLAKEYDKPFACEHAQLGENCSEAAAREARYAFLRRLAKEHNGKIYVAHHADDIIESIMINLLRGTGWRGLAPMQSEDVIRPLRELTKDDIYRYATEHGLSFRLDQTNNDDSYLRNRVRDRLRDLPKEKKDQLLKLYADQCQLKNAIDELIAAEIAQFDLARLPRDYFGTPETSEILREVLARQGILLTRPQLGQAMRAIHDFAPGKKLSLNRDHFLQINKYSFAIV